MFRILYAIQGTGNGHVARAREIIPILQQYGEVDIFLAGDQSNVKLPAAVRYKSKGLTFIYNKTGGLSYAQSLFKNNLWRIWREIKTFPVEEYDLIINDFEFITAWACRMRKKNCVGLSHQGAFLSKATPRPFTKNRLGEWVLKHYSPCTENIAFHFKAYDSFIYPPVIRQEIRRAEATNKGHYTVYLPAFADEEIYSCLKLISNKQWQVFSKYCQKPYKHKNVHFYPLSNAGFLKSFISCEGVLSSAGFETPSEALYLQKKLFVIPIKNQYEQYCNAEALRKLGVPVAKSLHIRIVKMLQEWVYKEQHIEVNFPDITESILENKVFAPRGITKRQKTTISEWVECHKNGYTASSILR